MIDQSGAVTGSFEYYPFGEVKQATGCSETAQQFTGKLLDSESGLQYFGARYLSNDLTRFTSVDPASMLYFDRENLLSLGFSSFNGALVPKESKAPALIKLSKTFRFTFLRSTNSKI